MEILMNFQKDVYQNYQSYLNTFLRVSSIIEQIISKVNMHKKMHHFSQRFYLNNIYLEIIKTDIKELIDKFQNEIIKNTIIYESLIKQIEFHQKLIDKPQKFVELSQNFENYEKNQNSKKMLENFIWFRFFISWKLCLFFRSN